MPDKMAAGIFTDIENTILTASCFDAHICRAVAMNALANLRPYKAVP